MKKQFTIYSLFISGLIFISFSSIDSHLKNSGQAPQSKTGAPGESTCADCHSGGSYTGTMTLQINGEDAIEYEPGVKYTLTFTANYGAPRYGFSITALNSEDSPAGQFTVTNDSNTSYSISQSNQRQYIGHKSASANNSWSFEWTAPDANVGNVTFYYVINAADQNGSTSGDKIETANTVITPMDVAETYALNLESSPAQGGTVSGDGVFEEGAIIAVSAVAADGFTFINWTEGETILSTDATFDYTMPAEPKTLTANFDADQTSVDDNSLSSLNIYPNPASDMLFIESVDFVNLIISDINGKIIYRSTDGLNPKIPVNVSNWESGIYLVRLYTEDKTITHKVSVTR